MGVEDLKNVAMEKCILKICMDKPKLLAEIGRLKPDDFYEQTHQLVYESLVEMFNAGDVIDHASIQDYMHRAGRLQSQNVSYINNLWIEIATADSLQHYVDTVLELSIRRQMYWYFDDVKNRVEDITDNVNTINAQISARLLDFQLGNASNDVYTFGDTFTDLLTAEPMGLKTGFTALDDKTWGLKPGHLVIIAGRPGMGKTAFALNIVANACKANKSCLFLSLEMTEQELKERLIHSELGMSKKELLRKMHEDETRASLDSLAGTENRINEWSEYINTVQQMDKSWKLKIVDKSTNNLLDLRNETLKMKAKIGLDLVVIDYLQLMSVDGYKNNRVGEITYLTTHLKNLAKELEVPILLLSQLSRGVESRDNKRPRMSDLRDSGSIEQDADKVLMLYRDKYYNPQNEDDTTEILIEKNRGSEMGTGTVILKFESKYARFRNTEEPSGEKASRKETDIVKGAFN